MLAVPCLVPGAFVAALLWGRRRGVEWLQPPLLFGVDRRDRKRILTAVRQGQHLEGQDGQVALDVARRLTRARWLAVFLPVIAAYLVVTTLIRGELDLGSIIPLAGGLIVLVASPFVWRDANRGRRYLREAGRIG